MSIINHTLNKYGMLFCTYLDLLTLNLVYFVPEKGNLVLDDDDDDDDCHFCAHGRLNRSNLVLEM